MATVIPHEDADFFQKVIIDSVEAGYIRKPAAWRGHGLEQYTVQESNDDCCCFCFLGGDRDGKLAVVLAVVVFVVGFFVGLYYTSRSAGSAVEARQDAITAQHKIADLTPIRPFFHLEEKAKGETQGGYIPNAETPPSFIGSYIPEQGPPSEEHQQSNPVLLKCYQDALLITKGRWNERTVTAISQGIMTLGAGFLTVAFIIMIVVEPEVLEISLVATGGGLVLTGAAIYAMKHGIIRKTPAQQAADRISHALFDPSIHI